MRCVVCREDKDKDNDFTRTNGYLKKTCKVCATRRENRPCGICGDPLGPRASQRYCSYTCAGIATSRRFTPESTSNETRVCTVCRQELPIAEFAWATNRRRPKEKSRRRGDCYACCRARIKTARLRRTPEQKQRAKDQHRYAVIKHKYHISRAAVESMIVRQNGLCGCCKIAKVTIYSAVDHNHACCHEATSCGRCVRGIVCKPCNLGLGFFNDDPDRLREGANYLENAWPEL